MKNITVSVDDAVYRAARIKAAEQDTSVSALVNDYLVKLASDTGEFARLAEEERALRARFDQFSAGARIARAELYDRRR